MSGSFASVQWNACVQRLDLGLYSHLKEFLGNGVRTHVNSKGKIPYTGCSAEDRTYDAASCRTASPTHYRLSYSGPRPPSNLHSVRWHECSPVAVPSWRRQYTSVSPGSPPGPNTWNTSYQTITSVFSSIILTCLCFTALSHIFMVHNLRSYLYVIQH